MLIWSSYGNLFSKYSQTSSRSTNSFGFHFSVLSTVGFRDDCHPELLEVISQQLLIHCKFFFQFVPHVFNKSQVRSFGDSTASLLVTTKNSHIAGIQYLFLKCASFCLLLLILIQKFTLIRFLVLSFNVSHFPVI